jgi:hypothetical protein
LDHPELIDTFRKLINLKNKQAGNKTEVSEQTLRESFEKIYDYMRLDTDTRDYMRSVDTLMNPENFQVALLRMTNGKFKFSVITYTEGVIRQTTSIAAKYALESGLSPETAAEFTMKVVENVTNSESYKNLLALAIDPNLGIDNQDYAIKLQTEIQELTVSGLRDVISEYKSEGFDDITTQELDEIFAEGSLEYLSIRRISIVDKLVKGETLLPNEKKVYEKFKEELDKQAAEEKTRKANLATEEEAVENIPVVGPDGEIISPEAPVEETTIEEVPVEEVPEVTPDNIVIVVDENGNETIEEVGTEIETLTPIEQPPVVQEPGEGIDSSDQLSRMLGLTPEREEAFEVEATEDGAINIVDRNNNIVNPEPFVNEEKAQEQADSLNVTRANTDFVQKFIGPMLQDPSDTSKIVEMEQRGSRSMSRYNSRNNTEFKTLEEYYATPKGRELLEAIRESVLTGKPVKYSKPKAVVTTLQVEDQPTLFSTTTTPSTSASLTLESLKLLNSKVEEFKAQLKDNSEKSSKFVNEGTVSESSIIEELQKITSCFS